MSDSLPLRANLEWLKKLCKQRLAAMRAKQPEARLCDAQLTVAREYGFPSWRRLRAHVQEVRQKLDELTPANLSTESLTPPDDPDLVQLFAAIEAGDIPIVTQILGRRPELAKAHGAGGQTPLHVAAQCNDPRLGVFLLACGADPEAKFGRYGHTPMSWAVTCNALEFAKTLSRLGNKPDLFCAAGIGSMEDVQACFDESGNLLPGAARTGSSRYAADGTLLPCPPQTAREQISDALYMACRNAQADVVRFLLDKKPDLNFCAYMGGTPLHWAYFGGSKAVIDMLVKAGADIGALDAVLHCTPRAFGICAPANWGFFDLVQRRLQNDPTLVNFMDGHTSPLHEAARSGSVDVVRLLLEQGADPLLRDGQGKTPLEIASERGQSAAAELLRQK